MHVTNRIPGCRVWVRPRLEPGQSWMVNISESTLAPALAATEPHSAKLQIGDV